MGGGRSILVLSLFSGEPTLSCFLHCFPEVHTGWSPRFPQQEAHQHILYWLHSLSVSLPLSLTSDSWDHLSNELLIPSFLSQGLPLGKLRRRQNHVVMQSLRESQRLTQDHKEIPFIQSDHPGAQHLLEENWTLLMCQGKF